MLKYLLSYKEEEGGIGPALTHEFTARGDKDAREKVRAFIGKDSKRIPISLYRFVSLNVMGE